MKQQICNAPLIKVTPSLRNTLLRKQSLWRREQSHVHCIPRSTDSCYICHFTLGAECTRYSLGHIFSELGREVVVIIVIIVNIVHLVVVVVVVVEIVEVVAYAFNDTTSSHRFSRLLRGCS